MPALTVLQLDTNFPRIPGDVACPQTYTTDIEVIRVPKADVASIVTSHPEKLDISVFEIALARAKSDLVVTSCGFLAYWQDHLASLTNKTVITSSLVALNNPNWAIAPDDLTILTYDATRLGAAYFDRYPTYHKSVVGLDPNSHLRQVIGRDLPMLTPELAATEVSALQETAFPHSKHILLECTNLPPYKPMLRRAGETKITDILTLIDAEIPGLVVKDFAT